MAKNNHFKIGKIIQILGLLLLGFLVYIGIKAYPRIIDVKTRYSQLTSIADELESMYENHAYNFHRAIELIDEADDHIKSIKNDVLPYYPLLNVVSKLPWIGPYSSQIQPTIEWMNSIFDSTIILVDVLKPMIDDSFYSEGKLLLFQQLISSQPLIEQARQSLILADQYSSQINFDLWPEKYQSKISKLKTIHSLLSEGIQILSTIPDIAGTSTQGTYLIMLQNSDELRPSGGFITAFGLVSIEQGVVTNIEFKDAEAFSYMAEVIQAPEPLKQILLAHYWLPQDGNWSPSFPEAAQQVQHLYFLATGVKTDGVIGLNQSTIKNLLAFTGPITIGGEIVDSTNAIQYMIDFKIKAEEAHQGDNRKDFIKLLANEMLIKFSQMTEKEQLIEFAKITWKMINTGDLQIYINNQKVETMLEKYNIDGGFHQGNADYLFLVDANLGFDKSDQVIQREISYTIDLSKNESIHTDLEINYNNPMVGELTCLQWGEDKLSTKKEYLYPTCYSDFFRIFRPADSKLLSFQSPGFSDSYFNYSAPWNHDLEINTITNGLVELSGFFVLPTNTSNKVTISQSLPPTIIHSANGYSFYVLTIQKQPGINQLAFIFRLKLPPGSVINPENSNIPLFNDNGFYCWQSKLENNLTTIMIAYK